MRLIYIANKSKLYDQKIRPFGILCLMLFLCACSEDETSKEDQVKQYIETGKLAAENRKYGDLAELFHESYHDDNGLDKQQLTNLVRAYFFTHKNIHLFIKIDDIIIETDDQAFVALHVAMAGNVISEASTLLSLRAKIYKFELDLIKEGEWLLKKAQWKVARVKDMM